MQAYCKKNTKDNVSTTGQDNMKIVGLKQARTEAHEADPKNTMPLEAYGKLTNDRPGDKEDDNLQEEAAPDEEDRDPSHSP